MKIILKKSYDKLGKPGEIVNVKDGYARNFLIPKGFAELATIHNISKLKVELEKIAEEEAKTRSNLESLTNKLNKLTLKFELNAGEDGKLFGSVTPQMISEAILEKGYDINRKEIDFPEAIKKEGSHYINVKLGQGFVGRVKVKVKGV